jgi:hypothetical protein
MRLWKIVSIMLALCLASGVVQARKAQLVDPDPVAIPAGLDGTQVVKDIKRALIGRGWSITTEQPGEIQSTLNLREHVARIKVDYDATQVRLSYMDSANLDYVEKKGKRYIHSNYLGWIGFLINDLNTNFKVSQAGG